MVRSLLHQAPPTRHRPTPRTPPPPAPLGPCASEADTRHLADPDEAPESRHDHCQWQAAGPAATVTRNGMTWSGLEPGDRDGVPVGTEPDRSGKDLLLRWPGSTAAAALPSSRWLCCVGAPPQLRGPGRPFGPMLQRQAGAAGPPAALPRGGVYRLRSANTDS